MKSLFAAAAAATAIATAGWAQPLSNSDARAKAEPFSEEQFGDKVDDPWRWMERAERAAEVEAFIRSSSEDTIAQLAALPGRTRIRDRIAASMQAGIRYGDLRSVGGNLFYRRTDPGAQLPKLVMRSAAGAERILYDPEADGTVGPAINNYSISPSGKTIALHTAPGGGEVGAIRFIDIATGRALSDKLDPVWGEFNAEWLDETTLLYTRMAPNAPAGADRMQNMRVFVHRLGRGDGAALLGSGVPLSPPFEPQEFPLAGVNEDSDWVIGGGVGARADSRWFVARRADVLAGRPNWRTITDYADQAGGGAVLGDMLNLISTKGAPNGKLIAVDLARGGTLASARTIVPAGDAILANVAATKDGLYLHGQTDGLSRLFFLPNGRGPMRELKLPMQGLISGMRVASGRESLSFAMVDWFTAPRWFAAKSGSIAPLGLDSASYAGVAGARQIRESATSADGTKVPMAILLPANRPSGPMPLLLEGYGSYGINTAEPYYAYPYFALLEEGAALAYCGTRGGGERGREWHEGGRLTNKPNAHADLIACGERLVQLGLTTPDRMTLFGSSAAGLIVPAAAMKRPDLFGSVIANVQILNPTRLAAAPNGANQYGEMGDPTNAAGYRGLLLSDAYRMAESAADIPDTLLTVGLNDRRVAPWMSAKFGARAMERFGGKRLILLRTDPNAGHGVGSAKDQTIEQYADMFAFMLSQAGVEGFAGP